MADNNTRVQPQQPTITLSEPTQHLVNTFNPVNTQPWHVAASAGKGMEDLAQSLNRAEGPIQKWGEQQNEQEVKDGAVAFATGLDKDGKAIRDGGLQPTQSAFFMRGYNMAKGKADAANYGLQFDKDWELSGLKNSPDPNEYNAFAAKKKQDFLASNPNANNSDYMAGFASAIGQVEADGRARQKAALNKTLIENTGNYLDSRVAYEVNQASDMNGDYADFSRRPALFASSLEGMLQEAVKGGMDPAAAKKIIATRVGAYIRESGDTSMFNVYLDPSLKGLRNADIDTHMLELQRTIDAQQRSDDHLDYELGERGRKEAARQLHDTMQQNMISDPTWRPDTNFERQWSHAGGDIIQLRNHVAGIAAGPKIKLSNAASHALEAEGRSIIDSGSLDPARHGNDFQEWLLGKEDSMPTDVYKKLAAYEKQSNKIAYGLGDSAYKAGQSELKGYMSHDISPVLAVANSDKPTEKQILDYYEKMYRGNLEQYEDDEKTKSLSRAVKTHNAAISAKEQVITMYGSKLGWPTSQTSGKASQTPPIPPPSQDKPATTVGLPNDGDGMIFK